MGHNAIHFLVGVIGAAAVLAAGPAAAGGTGKRGSECVPVVQCVLEQGGVDLATVDSIKVDKRSRTNGQGDRVFIGYQGWVRFKDRDGAIVISMYKNCRFQRTWTEGNIEWNEPSVSC